MSEADKYDVLDFIGKGSYGIIRKVRRKADGQIMCRKEINYARMGQKEREQLHSEFSILSSLRHPNIVAYYQREHMKATQNLHIYMEYCGNGDMARLIENLQATNQYAEEEFVWSIFAQLITALYRCHYGVDPPEVGKMMFAGVTGNRKPTPIEGRRQMMILHRDLKPENVFLAEDNSVKLGDFGLSKIMMANDFASTYVGTPYYMSPEVVTMERYTLHSDIWSLGCIMYELCSRSPPFVARTHLELCQRIRGGRFPPLPSFYSQELQQVIRSCLQVNPNDRPDTAQLLHLPIIRLMRKEREVVELGKVLRVKEDAVERRLKESEEREARMKVDQQHMLKELDTQLRGDWELRACLEIDRQVQAEMERLSNTFEAEVQARVQMELNKLAQAQRMESHASASSTSGTSKPSLHTGKRSTSSLSTVGTEQSMGSPMSITYGSKGKPNSTPSVKARAMYPGSPMDFQMVDPSPLASFASLSLSPRRNGDKSPPHYKNIFAAAAAARRHPTPVRIHVDPEESEDQTPSPTLQRAGKKAQNVQRPPLAAQRTAPNPRPHGFRSPSTNKGGPKPEPAAFMRTSRPGHASGSPGASTTQGKRNNTPNRRTSMVPGNNTVTANETGSPVRRNRQPTGATNGRRQTGGDEMLKIVTKKNMMNNIMKGRSLAELSNAPAGGNGRAGNGPGNGPTNAVKGAAPGEVKKSNEPTDARAGRNGKVGNGPENRPQHAVKGAAPGEAVRSNNKTPEVVWDPKRDEMPSPFLNRGVRVR
ncbi:MAG: G2-specific serine/threonine protein kinase [Peltula sp. TS41687]|nr:MAG: G2-specific serine/threonine protein kinase [Peltula sp. TS41687]